MELRPSFSRIALQCYGITAVLLLVLELWSQQGIPRDLVDSLLGVLLGAAWLGTGLFSAICFIYTPKYIRVDSEGFAIKTFTRERRYSWMQLEAIGPKYQRLVILKFADEHGYFISSAGFERKVWLEFVEFVGARFSSKRCLFWIGPYPVSFRD